jgi:hypothetical protein
MIFNICLVKTTAGFRMDQSGGECASAGELVSSPTSHVARYTSHVIRRTSHGTCHTSQQFRLRRIHVCIFAAHCDGLRFRYAVQAGGDGDDVGGGGGGGGGDVSQMMMMMVMVMIMTLIQRRT